MNNSTWIESNQSKIWKTAAVAALILLVILFMLHGNTQQLLEVMHRYSKLAVPISLLAYALLGATPVPSEPLTLFIVGLYGPWLAILLSTLGNTLAALIEFFVGGYINNLSDFEKRKAKLPFHLGNLPINSPIFLLLGRMLPGFGPKFVSIVSGVYRVPIWTYLWTALVSNTMGAVVVAFGGYGIFKLF